MKVGVIGLGKLGLPLACVLASKDFEVTGFDIDKDLLRNLKQKNFKTSEPGVQDMLEESQANVNFTSEIEELHKCEIVYCVLPTPSGQDGQFISDYLESCFRDLLSARSKQSSLATIVVVSTVMPGTTRSKLLPMIEEFNSIHLSPRDKVNLIYSPEFIALGSVVSNLLNPDMILVGAENASAADIHLRIQETITGTKPQIVLSWEEAEVAKLLVNCFVTMKISFANFIGEISSVIGGRAERVAAAIGLDSRIGSKYLRPGLGFSGPCFPRDNVALSEWSKKVGLSPDLFLATQSINNRQPRLHFEKLAANIPPTSHIGIFGLAYKPNTTVIDSSQILMVAELFVDNGFEVTLYDPNVLPESLTLDNVNYTDSAEKLNLCDYVIISRDFEPFAPSFLREKLIVI